jgi:hypothetical protein
VHRIDFGRLLVGGRLGVRWLGVRWLGAVRWRVRRRF